MAIPGRSRWSGLILWAVGVKYEVENPGFAALGVDFEDVAVLDDVFLADLLAVV